MKHVRALVDEMEVMVNRKKGARLKYELYYSKWRATVWGVAHNHRCFARYALNLTRTHFLIRISFQVLAFYFERPDTRRISQSDNVLLIRR